MKMRKIIIIIFITIITLLVLKTDSYAVGVELKKEIRQEIKQEIKARRVEILGATLTVKNGSVLTITKDGKTYTVNTNDKTQLRRRFWGKATLDEMQTGDILNVRGKWTDEAKTTVEARLVRDLSIEMRHGAFIGTVKEITGGGFVMEPVNRGNQTVTITSDSKLVNRKGGKISQSDIAIGHRVMVKGLWNRKANTITQVSHVKDFSLPPRVTPAK